MAQVFGNFFSATNKKNADLEPFGGKYTPMEKYESKKKRQAMLEKMMSSNDKSSKPKGPSSAQLAAAKLKAKKEKGQARRKKYEAAQTMAKKMKLIFVD